jgi:hypothetical protein
MPEVEWMDRVFERERPMIEMSAETKGSLARPDVSEKLPYVVEGVGCSHVRGQYAASG